MSRTRAHTWQNSLTQYSSLRLCASSDSVPHPICGSL